MDHSELSLSEDAICTVLHWVVEFDKPETSPKYNTVSTTFHKLLSNQTFWRTHALYLWHKKNPKETYFPFSGVHVDYIRMTRCLSQGKCWHLSVCDIPRLNRILLQISNKDENNLQKKCDTVDCKVKHIDATLCYCVMKDCMHCGCSRTGNRHALEHSKCVSMKTLDGEMNTVVHPVTVHSNGKVWCYSCNIYIQYKK